MASTNSYTREDIQNNRRMSEYNDLQHKLNKTEIRLHYLLLTEDMSEIEHMQMYDRWKPKDEDVQEEIDFLVNKKLPDIEQHMALFIKSFPNLVSATMKRWLERRQELRKEWGDVDSQKH